MDIPLHDEKDMETFFTSLSKTLLPSINPNFNQLSVVLQLMNGPKKAIEILENWNPRTSLEPLKRLCEADSFENIFYFINMFKDSLTFLMELQLLKYDKDNKCMYV